MRLQKLYLIVFLAGASVMTLELTGSRILAPFLGSSIYVWTSLIGIILGALSFGYFWGGSLADADPSPQRLSRLLFGAAVTCVLIVPLQFPLLNMLKDIGDLRLAAVVATLLLFALPAVLLGTVTPFALRLAIDSVEHSGTVAGRLYALSTLGSIVGTFLPGFVLFAWIGSAQIILCVSFTLFCCSLLASVRDKAPAKVFFILLIASTSMLARGFWSELAEEGLIDLDTEQQRVLIIDTTDAARKRKIRMLITDPLGSQSARFLDGGGEPELASEYSKLYELAFAFNPEIKTVLMLGGGAYSYPQYFLAKHPDATLDVVEIDPGMTRIATEYFGLRDDPRLRITHEDARVFLNRNEARYDAIMVDAFSSSPSIPFQLTTKEAVELMHGALHENGVVLVNVITGIHGPEGRFLRAEVATYKSVFPEVHLFPVDPGKSARTTQNVLILALKTPRPSLPAPEDRTLAMLMERRFHGEVPLDVPVLTDNFAPVEHHILPALRAMEKKLQEPLPASG